MEKGQDSTKVNRRGVIPGEGSAADHTKRALTWRENHMIMKGESVLRGQKKLIITNRKQQNVMKTKKTKKELFAAGREKSTLMIIGV